MIARASKSNITWTMVWWFHQSPALFIRYGFYNFGLIIADKISFIRHWRERLFRLYSSFTRCHSGWRINSYCVPGIKNSSSFRIHRMPWLSIWFFLFESYCAFTSLATKKASKWFCWRKSGVRDRRRRLLVSSRHIHTYCTSICMFCMRCLLEHLSALTVIF